MVLSIAAIFEEKIYREEKMKKMLLSVFLGLVLGMSAWAQSADMVDSRSLSDLHKEESLRPVKKLGASVGHVSAGSPGGLDLKIKNMEIDPEPAGTSGPRIVLGTYRSYRATVEIQKTVALPANASFLVRTECIRDGQATTIGQARIGDATGWYMYACYNIFPAEAGAGDCLIRTTIDAQNEISETDESAISNIWDRAARLVGPAAR